MFGYAYVDYLEILHLKIQDGRQLNQILDDDLNDET